VITKKDTHSALIYLMMGVMDDIHEAPSIMHAENEFPSDKDVDFPLSNAADDFYKKGGKPFLQKYLPYWAASFVGKLLIILLPILAIVIPVSQTFTPIQFWYYNRIVGRFYRQLVITEKKFEAGELPEITKNKLEKLRHEVEHIVRLEKFPGNYSYLIYNFRSHLDDVIERHGFKKDI